MTLYKKSQTEALTDEALIREAEDDSAWEPPIHVSAKPWARRIRVRRSRFKQFADIFGGVLLGAGISALVSMLLGQVTKTGWILVFALTAAGSFLITLDDFGRAGAKAPKGQRHVG